MGNEDRQYASATDLSRRYKVSHRTIKRWTEDGVLPKPLRLSETLLRYDVAECDLALERHSATFEERAAQ